jgi:hypothetical protein
VLLTVASAIPLLHCFKLAGTHPAISKCNPAALPLLLQATVMDMKSALEGRIRRAEDIAAAFAHFKREVCLAAEHSKTGRPVGEKALAALEERGAQQLQLRPACAAAAP